MNFVPFLLLYIKTLLEQYLPWNLSSKLFHAPHTVILSSNKSKEASHFQSVHLRSLPTLSTSFPTPQPYKSRTLSISIPGVPSKAPTTTKTSRPSVTWKPSYYPTSVPTSHPTSKPSPRPTRKPSPVPTSRPSPKPSSRPSSRPTSIPTSKPTAHPTPIPKKKPTPKPTRQPITKRPTRAPTTFVPTESPSALPSQQPSSTNTPTNMPSTINPSPLPSSPTPSPSATTPLSAAPSAFFNIPPLSLQPLTLVPAVPVQSSPPVIPSTLTSPPSPAPIVIDPNKHILFVAVNTVTGVNITAFQLSASAKALFRSCVASSMTNVPETAVAITSVEESFTSSTHLRRRLSAVSNKIAAVTYSVTVAATSLPYANLTASYNTLTRQLAYQVRTGNFTKTLRRLAQQLNVPELTLANSTSISIGAFQVVYTTHASSTSSSDSAFYTSWPLYGQVVLPIAIVLVAALVLAIAIIGCRTYCNESQDIARQRSEDMSLSNIYKTEYKAVDGKKPNIWNFISLGQPKPYDASKEVGEHKAIDNTGTGSELVIVPAMNGDSSPLDAFFPPPVRSPPRRETSPPRANASANLTAASLSTPNSNHKQPSQDGAGKKSSAGKSRTTATRENSPMRGAGGMLKRTDSKRSTKGDFTRGDFQ